MRIDFETVPGNPGGQKHLEVLLLTQDEGTADTDLSDKNFTTENIVKSL